MQPDAHNEATRPPVATNSPTPRILVVDDEPSVHLFVRRILGQNAALTCVRSVEEGLALLEEQAQAIDLVLLDLYFGPESPRGEDLLPTLTARWPALGIIMITVEEDLPLAVRCIRLGALDYLVKGSTLPAALPYAVSRAQSVVHLRRERDLLRAELQLCRDLEQVVCRDGVSSGPKPAGLSARLIRPFEEITRDYFIHALKRCDGDVVEAARELQVPVDTYHRRLLEWGIIKEIAR